jgi:hypothetical protein
VNDDATTSRHEEGRKTPGGANSNDQLTQTHVDRVEETMLTTPRIQMDVMLTGRETKNQTHCSLEPNSDKHSLWGRTHTAVITGRLGSYKEFRDPMR